ncbi:polysaccharide deacetylase family protein [Carboxylicivirga sp. N1Y90]|uniref:polysaccharide deacetylase family protein n=1 Tax=Carboxylicivirga fragile TaxID=3417571 RepID=UPI003D347C87|nr:polysaccharide deacetylase family protein [Marinilabiliaceae bacterium N1Y90]
MSNKNSNQKYLIIHADDAGLSHSQNKAIMQSLEEGVVSSYSIMVPCPCFDEIAQFAKQNPEFDCGVHLTLTCEWKSYKFGPVLPVTEVPSLVDDDGYFPMSRDEVRKKANPIEVEKELRAQIDRMLSMGIKISHLDSHMYTIGLSPDLLDVYKRLGRDYNLPVFLDEHHLNEFGIDIKQELSASDFCVDNTYLGDYSMFEKGQLSKYYEHILNELPNGFNMLLVHPAFDDDEMRQITIDHPNFGSEWRQIDFDFLNDNRTSILLKENNIQLISWGEVLTKKPCIED